MQFHDLQLPCPDTAWQSWQRSTPGSLGCGLLSLPWPQLQTSKTHCNPKEETGRATAVPGAGAAQRDPSKCWGKGNASPHLWQKPRKASAAGRDNSLLDIVGACSCSQSGRKDFSSPCPVTSPCLPCFDPATLQYNESVTPLGISQLLPRCVAQLLTISRWWQGCRSCPPPLERPLGTKKKLF